MEPGDGGQAAEPPVLIIGGGIIGASTAYYLSLLGRRSTIVEWHAVAGAASGRAGGFLARTWCDGSPTRALARPSFDMHAALAAALVADTGYRPLAAYSASLRAVDSSDGRGRGGGGAKNRLWMDGAGVRVEACGALEALKPGGGGGGAAQVHPRLLTEALVAAAGSRVVLGEAQGLERAAGGRVTGVRVRGAATVACSHVVVAMGPWTTRAAAWFAPGALPPVLATKAASIVFDAVLPPAAVFTEYVAEDGVVREPEVYPRADEVYVCGSAAAAPLPDDPAAVSVDRADADVLERFARRASAALAHAEVRARQSCYLPQSADGVPIVGRIGAEENAYVAAGHGCWGVLNSPASGRAVAEMIVHGESRAIDARPFCPSRFAGGV